MTKPTLSWMKVYHKMGLKLHPNTQSNMVRHVPVYQSKRTRDTSFHAYFQAKQLLKSFMAVNRYEQIAGILGLTCPREYAREWTQLHKRVAAC